MSISNSSTYVYRDYATGKRDFNLYLTISEVIYNDIKELVKTF